MEARLDTGIDDLWGALTDPDRLSQFRVRVEDRAPLQVNRVMAPGGVEPPRADSKSAALSAELRGLGARVADGTRTRDHRDHNPGLYQLSYRHLARGEG